MGLYLFNISVDTADPQPEHIPEDLSINDQESLVELVIEKVLGFENAIREYDDHDTEDSEKKKNFKVEFLSNRNNPQKKLIYYLFKESSHFNHYSEQLDNGYFEIDSPPPRV